MYDGEGSQIQGGLSFCEVSSDVPVYGEGSQIQGGYRAGRRLTHRLMCVCARLRRSEAFLSFRRF